MATIYNIPISNALSCKVLARDRTDHYATFTYLLLPIQLCFWVTVGLRRDCSLLLQIYLQLSNKKGHTSSYDLEPWPITLNVALKWVKTNHVRKSSSRNTNTKIHTANWVVG